jgi:hypothetical protein
MEPCIESTIPATLLEKLIQIKPVLETQGTILPHKRYFRLRYRAECEYGYVVHRSISLGSDQGVLNAVETLLARWRADRQAREAEEEKRQAETRLEQRRTRLSANMFATVNGNGLRRQRQLRDFYHRCIDDPLLGMCFVVSHELPPRRKIGRPRKLIWTGAQI